MQLIAVWRDRSEDELSPTRMAEGRHHDIKPGLEIFVALEEICVIVGEYKLAEG